MSWFSDHGGCSCSAQSIFDCRCDGSSSRRDSYTTPRVLSRQRREDRRMTDYERAKHLVQQGSEHNRLELRGILDRNQNICTGDHSFTSEKWEVLRGILKVQMDLKRCIDSFLGGRGLI